MKIVIEIRITILHSLYRFNQRYISKKKFSRNFKAKSLKFFVKL